MGIQADTVYRFKKSGSLVRTKSSTDYGRKGSWVVARVDTGKEMVVHGDALIDPNDPAWS